MVKYELLAPAGDLERLKVAILYGADAVYIGGPAFGLRANATNFSIEEIEEAVKFAHKHNKKVYVTVNIVLHNQELKELKEYLIALEKANVDAIIVSDPIVISIAKECTNLEIHISTQQSTLNKYSCAYLKSIGATRIVLGREASRKEIKEIIDNVDVEIEIFIHGAMCASYSGRCVLSNFLTARDANRGGCSQVCRFDFDLYDDKLNAIKGERNFTFCSKDLSMLKYIPDMIDDGISSFKIEGRMRSIYYLATVISTYRNVIDTYLNDKENYKYDLRLENILDNVANRDSIAQFYDGNYSLNTNYYNNRIEVSNQDFLGVVLDYDEKTKEITIEQRNYFKKGDNIEIFGYNHDVYKYQLLDIYDIDNNILDAARHPKQIIKFYFPYKVEKLFMMRIDKDKNM